MRKNMWHLPFWVTSFNIIFRSIHLLEIFMISFFFAGKSYTNLYMCNNYIIHSFVEGHLHCFPFLSTMDMEAVNIVEQGSVE